VNLRVVPVSFAQAATFITDWRHHHRPPQGHKIKGDRALPIVWEPERVAAWKATGNIPSPVMVWPDQLVAEFLDYAAEHAPDLHPMFHFIAYRGPRRGEACGLLESEVRLDKKKTSIVNQLTVVGSTTVQKPPKSRAGNRDLILDNVTTDVLRTYHARKAKQRLAAGAAWPDTGLFFVRPDGRPWHPNSVSQRFRRLVTRAALPHPPTRPAPRRRHPGTGRRRRHQNRPGTTRPLHRHPHPRHLPKRHPPPPPPGRRRRRQTNHPQPTKNRLTGTHASPASVEPPGIPAGTTAAAITRNEQKPVSRYFRKQPKK
jgi:hypothetical protein